MAIEVAIELAEIDCLIKRLSKLRTNLESTLKVIETLDKKELFMYSEPIKQEISKAISEFRLAVKSIKGKEIHSVNELEDDLIFKVAMEDDIRPSKAIKRINKVKEERDAKCENARIVVQL